MIFLVGHHASGKTTVASILSNDYGFIHLETGEIVRDFKQRTDSLLPMTEWEEKLRISEGARFIDDLIVDSIKTRTLSSFREGQYFQDMVITGNREYSGVVYIKENLELPSNFGLKEPIVAVVADRELLFKRFVFRNRDRGDSKLSFEDFEDLLNFERKRGLDELLAKADYIIDNNGDEEDLGRRVGGLFTHELGYSLIERKV